MSRRALFILVTAVVSCGALGACSYDDGKVAAAKRHACRLTGQALAAIDGKAPGIEDVVNSAVLGTIPDGRVLGEALIKGRNRADIKAFSRALGDVGLQQRLWVQSSYGDVSGLREALVRATGECQ